jgi:hypothetical protein
MVGPVDHNALDRPLADILSLKRGLLTLLEKLRMRGDDQVWVRVVEEGHREALALGVAKGPVHGGGEPSVGEQLHVAAGVDDIRMLFGRDRDPYAVGIKDLEAANFVCLARWHLGGWLALTLRTLVENCETAVVCARRNGRLVSRILHGVVLYSDVGHGEFECLVESIFLQNKCKGKDLQEILRELEYFLVWGKMSKIQSLLPVYMYLQYSYMTFLNSGKASWGHWFTDTVPSAAL